MWEKKQEKKEEKDDMIREVFRASDSKIAESRSAQCQTHSFRKLSENEIMCTRCMTALIVNPDVLDSMLAK